MINNDTIITKENVDEIYSKYFLNDNGELDESKLDLLPPNILHPIVVYINKKYKQHYLDETFLMDCKSLCRELSKVESCETNNTKKCYINNTKLINNNNLKLPVTYSVKNKQLYLDNSVFYNKMNLYDLYDEELGYIEESNGNRKQRQIMAMKHQAATCCYNKDNGQYIVKNNGALIVGDKKVEGNTFLTIVDIFEFVVIELIQNMSEKDKENFCSFAFNLNNVMDYSHAMKAKVDPANFIDDKTVLKNNDLKKDIKSVFSEKEKQYLSGENLFYVKKEKDRLSENNKNFKLLTTFVCDNETYEYYYNPEIFSHRDINAFYFMDYIYMRDILMRVIVFLYPMQYVYGRAQRERGTFSYKLRDLTKEDGQQLIGILKKYELVTPLIKKIEFDKDKYTQYIYFYQVG